MSLDDILAALDDPALQSRELPDQIVDQFPDSEQFEIRETAREINRRLKGYNFWTKPSRLYDPKSKFRWRVIIPGMGLEDAPGTTGGLAGFNDSYPDKDSIIGNVWYAKTIEKPSFSVKNKTEGRYITDGVIAKPQLTVTTPTFKPITMTLIDPVYPNATRKLIRYLRRGGFQETTALNVANNVFGGSTDSYLKTNRPVGAEAITGQLNFKPSPNTYGEMYIEQLNANQLATSNILADRPSVLERWTLVDPYPLEVNFGTLDYSSDDLVEITVVWGFRTIKVFFPTIGSEEEYTYFKDVPVGENTGGGGPGS